MNLETMLYWHNDLREFCEDIASKNNGELMGEYAWLRHAMQARDITLTATPNGIQCYGTCWTTKTMDHEWFDFIIPLDLIPEELRSPR